MNTWWAHEFERVFFIGSRRLAFRLCINPFCFMVGVMFGTWGGVIHLPFIEIGATCHPAPELSDAEIEDALIKMRAQLKKQA